MTITYTVRFGHLWWFNTVHQFRSPAVQLFFLAVSALVAWSVSQSDSCRIDASCLAITVVAFVLVYAIFAASQFVFNALFLYSRNNRNVLTQHHVELKEDGMSEETKFCRSHFMWPGIHRIVTSAGIVAVYVTAHSAVLIPKSAFSSNEQRRQFVEIVRKNLSAT